MAHLLNRLVLFLFCTVLLLTRHFDRILVILTLICFIVECYEIYRPNRVMFRIQFLLFAIAMVLFPSLAYFLPLRLYSAITWKDYVLSLVLFELLAINEVNILLIVVLSAMAMLLGYYTEKQLSMHSRFLNFRDDQREQEVKLVGRNKELLEKQDYEIYAATLHERNRIAREIHDHVGHQLSSSILQLAALQTVAKDEQMKGHLDTLKGTLNQAMNDIRSSVHGLYDESMDLESSIKELLKQYTFCAWHFDYDVQSSLDRKLKFSFVAIVKEALSNTSRHSDATQISIRILEHPALIQLQIDDNGTGKGIISEAGIGLANMRDRVEQLNGRILIKYEDGFHIFISIDKKGDAK